MKFKQGFKDGFAEARRVIANAFDSAEAWERRSISETTSEKIEGRIAGLKFGERLARRILSEIDDRSLEKEASRELDKYIERIYYGED